MGTDRRGLREIPPTLYGGLGYGASGLAGLVNHLAGGYMLCTCSGLLCM